MKTLRLSLFLITLAIVSSCGERKVSNDTEHEPAGVGAAPDSANQKLDSAITAPDTATGAPLN